MERRALITDCTTLIGESLLRTLNQNSEPCFAENWGEDFFPDSEQISRYLNENSITDIYFTSVFEAGVAYNQNHQNEMALKNLKMGLPLAKSIYETDTIGRLINFGSSCMYSPDSSHPYNEKNIFVGRPEKTNLGYAFAKCNLAYIFNKLGEQSGISVLTIIPSNLFGENDTFGERAHVIAALVSKFQNARIKNETEVSVWGTGYAVRDFLYVDEFTKMAIEISKQNECCGYINIGSGEGMRINQLVELIAEITEYKGRILYDSSKPEGVKSKVLNCDRLHSMGLSASKNSFVEGIKKINAKYLEHIKLKNFDTESAIQEASL